MKSFKEYTHEVSGLKFIFEHLTFCSPLGRRKLLNQHFITDHILLQRELDLLEQVVIFINKGENQTAVKGITQVLQQSRDIHQTLLNVKYNRVLDDVELFEIKKFALLSQQITELLNSASLRILLFQDLTDVVDLLDPEQNRLPHFYIYSSYDPELEKWRKKAASTEDKAVAEQCRWESLQIEDRIRERLSGDLHAHAAVLQWNLDQMATLDLLLAKANQAITYNLTKPVIATETTVYQSLFNPAVQSALVMSNKQYQPIDIRLDIRPCLITGANMSGKTVLLKTIALSQYMFQFSFYLPAKQAAVLPVEEVLLSVGDNHSEMNGLSSFAAEILTIDHIIRRAKQGKRLLVLVDELARTTNPEEGKALVNAFIEIISKYELQSLVTTHYSGITAPARRLRMRGLSLQDAQEKITPANINNYMDYTLMETTEDDIPMEAIKIAEIFGVDEELLRMARKGEKGRGV